MGLDSVGGFQRKACSGSSSTALYDASRCSGLTRTPQAVHDSMAHPDEATLQAQVPMSSSASLILAQETQRNGQAL